MRYTFDLIVVSIGIIGFFQLVSIIDISCILIYLYVCMLSFQLVSISIGIKTFYTYICVLFMLKLEFLMTNLFQLI